MGKKFKDRGFWSRYKTSDWKKGACLIFPLNGKLHQIVE